MEILTILGYLIMATLAVFKIGDYFFKENKKQIK